MRSFAQKQNQSQRQVASSLARSNMTTPGPNHHMHHVLHVQYTIGNQAVQRTLQTNAEELEVDSTSTAASRFTYDFSRIPLHAPAAGRIHQRTTTGDAQARTAPPIAHEVLCSSGQPLDVATRAFMEPRFGHDFSRVRVHLDSQAAASARAVGALAYTVGRDIVFAHGQFAPHTGAGQRLLAHELAHTLQQGVAAEQGTTGDLRVGQLNDPCEHEAESVAASVLSGRVALSTEQPPSAAVRPDGQPTLRRQPRPDAGAPDPGPLQTLPPKEERSVTTPPAAQPACKFPSDIALPCTPKVVSNVDFLKTGAPEEAFGVTRIPSGAKFPVPEVVTKPVARDKHVIQKTQATPAPCESFVTKAGHFSRTVSLDANDPKQRTLAEKCGTSLVIKFNVTADGEKRINRAEMEHCADFKYAFDISLGCYAAVVNDFAKRKTPFPSHADAVDAVTRRVGLKPDSWSEHYLQLLGKSAERDTNKWHTAIWQGPALFVEQGRSGRCNPPSGEVEINGRSYPEVDKHKTPDVIE